ncbi:hypothetical protein ACHQM5_028272 [Ranunculus cassubicifolius]
MRKCSSRQTRDRISYLPDPIISHIVSFLSMKDAMRACVLSRQWEHVCSSLSNLEFDQRDFRLRNGSDIQSSRTQVDDDIGMHKRKLVDFRNFVDKMLLRHEGSNVQRFRLWTEVDDECISSHHVNAWISFALDHKVQDLDVCFRQRERTKLSHRLFTCPTLTALSLSRVKMELPSTVKFPILKSLCLDYLIFNDENTMNKLLSPCTCPVLENLIIRACSLSFKTLSILNIPNLKCFKLDHIRDLVVNLSAPFLRELDYVCLSPLNVSIQSLASLLTASFDFYKKFSGYPDFESYFDSATKILKGLQNVERLGLMRGFIEILANGRNLSACLPPSLSSVKYLRLGMLPTKLHVQMILLLLTIFPNVRTVRVEVDYSEIEFEEESSLIISNVTNTEEHLQLKEVSTPEPIMVNYLRTVEMENFGGSESELELLRFFLENVKSLETLNVGYRFNLKRDTVLEKTCFEKISTFTRISPLVSVLTS